MRAWKRQQEGPTGAQPPNAGTVSAFGRMPMRNRIRIVARLCARRPGGMRGCCTRKLPGKWHQARAGAGERSAAQRALESSCYAPDIIIRIMAGIVENQPFWHISCKKALLFACYQAISGILKQPEFMLVC